MKKILFSIIGTLLITLGLLGWRSSTFSASGLPYSNPEVEEKEISACTKTTANTIYLMRRAWLGNLNTLLDQEKPTSEMVDEAFQSLGTYRCWLDYLCETVLYSANADPETKPTGGGSFPPQIEKVPGCAPPYKVQVPELQLQYIPACKVSNENTIEKAGLNYSKCRTLVQQDFADNPSLQERRVSRKTGDTLGDDLNVSPAFIMLETALKSNSAEQEVRPLRDKFTSILLKMLSMESHMTTLKEQVLSLDARTPCYCTKCD